MFRAAPTKDADPPAAKDAPSDTVQAEAVIAQLASVFLRQSAGVVPARVENEREDESSSEQPQSGSLYRALVEQIPAVLFIAYLDKGTCEAYVSPQIETALGYSQEEWLDDPIRWYRHIHPEDKGRWSMEAAAMFAMGKPLKSSYRVIAKNGKVVWFRCEAKMECYPDGRPWFILGVGFDITDLKQTEETLREKTEALRSLSASLFRLQDQERRRIARDLHDGVGQYLVALKMNMDVLASQATSDQDIWAESKRILEQCLSETRTLSHLLHPPMLDDAGLISATRWYVEGFAQRSGIAVNLDISLDPQRLPDAIEVAVFRVLQESLTNVHRHSGSKTLDITLQANNAEVSLEVRDYGCGIPPEVLAQFRETGVHAGVGLAGMRERVHELGGKFEITSDGRGTLTRVVLPKEVQSRG